MSGRTSGGPAGGERRRQLVEIAYHLIAERGFEGLRTRTVAERAGINQATLHYHFPTKDDLVRGVVDYLIEQYSSPHAAYDPLTASPLDLVRAEFLSVTQLAGNPHLIIVLDELALHALRDPVVADLLNTMDAGWHAYMAALLRRGIAAGEMRPDLDADDAARLVLTAIKGLRVEILRKDPAAVDHLAHLLIAQVERWLTSPG